MTQRYDIYAIGNALVDTEVEVSDAFLERMGIDKGMMTLVDEVRQHELVAALNSDGRIHRRASGGSACNTAVAAQYFGARTYYACRVADDDTGHFFVDDLRAVQDTLVDITGGEAAASQTAREGMYKVIEGTAAKRVMLRIKPEKIVSWDHRKLGGKY